MSLLATAVPRREVPWIGIGVQGRWSDYREALHDSQLDFNVVSKPAKVEIGSLTGWAEPMSTITYEDVPGAKVNIVEGSNKILGCVSTQYGLIQNKSAFSLLQPLCDAGAVITNAGMTEQGLCFMVARWSVETFGGEEYNVDVMCTNSFNGAYPCGIIITPVRIFCQNMYRKLMKNDNLLHVRHMSLAPSRIEKAIADETKLVSYINGFGEKISYLSDKTLGTDEIRDFIALLFPYPSNEEAVRYETSVAQIDRLREEFVDVYVNAGDVRKFGNHAIRYVHAYYDYLSHDTNGRRAMPGDQSHKRLTRLVSGESVNTKALNTIIK